MSDWVVGHDFFYQFGGAERVTAAIAAAIQSNSTVYIAGLDSVVKSLDLRGAHRIGPGIINSRNYRALVMMYADWLRTRRPVEGNLISSSYGLIHMLPATGKRVVYCHSPLRQAWSGAADYSRSLSWPVGQLWSKVGAPRHRTLDLRSVPDISEYIATSRAVQDRIWKYYGRRSVIIPPPISASFAHYESRIQPARDYWVWAGRIVEPYKRVGMLIDAFTQLPAEKLVIVGDGRDRRHLEAAAPRNVTFVGPKSGDDLAQLFAGAKATIFPSVDDFGMVAIESMAVGTPVIAVREGGALDTVVEGVSGIFMRDHSPAGVIEAVRRAKELNWESASIAAYASKFGPEVFAERIQLFLEAL